MVSRKDYKKVTSQLENIYQALNKQEVFANLEQF